MLEDKIDTWQYMRSLINTPPKKKKVKCLKCRVMFTGSTNGRICSKCSRPNSRKNYYIA